MVERPPAGTIPDSPGSYQFRDADGRIIYVGKAKSLRSRVGSYFQDPRRLPSRTRQMVETAETVDWIQVGNELEALMLEYALIQEHKPRFNVRFIDDKSYPFLCVTTGDPWPRAMVIRGKRRRGNRYFGPFAQAHVIRDTLDLLLRSFPVRTCSDATLRRHQRLGKPCLLYHIEKCSGPCVGAITEDAYDALVAELLRFLEGDSDQIVARIERQMAEASDELDFERAARLRDQLEMLRKAGERQQMVFTRDQDVDVIGIYQDEIEAAVQVFFVRRGRVMGRRGLTVDKAEDLEPAELVSRVLEQLYFDDNPIGWPKEVLVPELPAQPDLYEEWMTNGRGSRVSIRVPQRGDKRALHETVTENAREAFTRHRMKRSADHNSRARALKELQEYLHLPVAPLRIECFDMSHIQGTDYVGSMVVVEDGLAKPSEYRRFRIKTVDGNDDFAAMEEVLTRRFSAYLDERERPADQRPGKFVYPPQLLVVDGGKGQLSSAVKVLDQLNLRDDIPVVSLAKQFEEVFVPGQSESIRIPRQSEALFMLQRIRDESHRFAITYHRSLRAKRMRTSALDGIAGLGPARQKRLVKELGGVNNVKQADLDTLRKLTWLPDSVAEAVYAELHQAPRRA